MCQPGIDALRAGVCVTLLKFNFLRRVSRNLPKHQKNDHGSVRSSISHHGQLTCTFPLQRTVTIATVVPREPKSRQFTVRNKRIRVTTRTEKGSLPLATHSTMTMQTFLKMLELLRHCLPKPFYPQSRKNRVRSCSRVKSLFPELGRQPGFSGRAS